MNDLPSEEHVIKARLRDFFRPHWLRVTAVGLMTIGALTVAWLIVEAIKSALGVLATVIPYVILIALAAGALAVYRKLRQPQIMRVEPQVPF